MEIKGGEYGRLGKLSKFEQIFYLRVKIYICIYIEQALKYPSKIRFVLIWVQDDQTKHWEGVYLHDFVV